MQSLFFNLRFILLVLVLIASSFITRAQTNLDSLYKVWKDQSQADSTRVDAYNQYIFNGFLFTNPDSAFVLAEALHILAKKQNYLEAAAIGYNLQGVVNYFKGNYPSALEYYEKSLAIREEIGVKKSISSSLVNIGNVYFNQGNYPRSLEYYERSLTISKEIGDKYGISISLNNIGRIYSDLGNYPRALEYYEKCLAISEEVGDKNGIATGFSNIGRIYLNQRNYERALEYFEKSLNYFKEISYTGGIARNQKDIGKIHQIQGNYPLALEYYEKSMAIQVEAGDKKGIAENLGNVGGIYSDQGNYSRALEYYEKSLAIWEEIGDKRGIAMILNKIGNIYQNQSKENLALEFCQRGLTLSEEIEILDQQKDACQCLYDTYKAMGKSNKALVYLEKVRVLEDSLQAEETNDKLQQMEFAKQLFKDSVEAFEKERQIELTHQEDIRSKEKTRNISIGIGVFIFLLAGGLYSRLHYVRKSKVALQSEKDRSDNLLLNILPEEIAQELKEKGKADARDFDEVSILFTDFKDFTEQSSKLSAADLVNEINHCFEAFDGIMEKYGIEKIKTIGDAYMAAGGLPVPTDDSVKNTILAALEMQEFIAKRKAENDAIGRPAFEMRVGIHTGPVVAGIVGVKKFQYDIWGDTVNTASRMESGGEAGKVNISQATYELLNSDPDFVFESRGKIEAKGKGTLDMYFVQRNEV